MDELTKRNFGAVQQALVELSARVEALSQESRDRDRVFAELHQELQDVKRDWIVFRANQAGSGPTGGV